MNIGIAMATEAKLAAKNANHQAPIYRGSDMDSEVSTMRTQ